jgi:hypothetical protein
MGWVIEELAGADLGDSRLDMRLIKMVERFSQCPEAGIAEACGSRAATRGAYRFLENARVQPERILEPHAEQTARRAAEHPLVLVAQDTSEINLTDHPGTRGLGYLGSPQCRGVLLHSLLAISPKGVPLGVLRQFTWTRPLEELGKRHRRRQRPIEQKESRRWLDGLAAVEEALPEHPHVVLMGDRESDIFDLFSAPRSLRVDLLVRVCRETRRVEHPARYLDRALQQSPVRGMMRVELPRRGNRPRREAVLGLRWLTLMVHAPRHGPKRGPVEITFLLAEELDPPANEPRIRWVLATTMRVDELEEAVRAVQWYAYRWTIEHFHFVLKSGCRIEHLQLETVERMERAIATYSIVAWRTLWLTREARQTPDAPCTGVLEEYEWQALCAISQQTTQLPKSPPTLRAAVRMIAQLGGFLGRKCDGEPGPKSVWRGLRRLHDIAETWRLIRSTPEDPPS